MSDRTRIWCAHVGYGVVSIQEHLATETAMMFRLDASSAASGYRTHVPKHAVFATRKEAVAHCRAQLQLSIDNADDARSRAIEALAKFNKEEVPDAS